MPTGLSLHLGLNYVNPDRYGGWDGELAACEFDANDMQALAAGRGFQTQKLLRADCTAANVIAALAPPPRSSSRATSSSSPTPATAARCPTSTATSSTTTGRTRPGASMTASS